MARFSAETNQDFIDAAEGAIEAARRDFLAFCMLMDQKFVVGPHHRLIADKLNALAKGEIRRLMIQMSPRSGKSYMASQHFPAWCIGHNPSWQYIGVSHSAVLAEDFSRDVRNLVSDDLFQLMFPGIALRPDSRAANRWHTNVHGVYAAVGAGGRIAGRGANIASLDDPLSEQDAFSKANRERINRWYPSGLRSRLMPNARVLLITTRWHEADLAGFLLKAAEDGEDADQWEVLKIPAILDEESCALLSDARLRCIGQGILPQDYPELQVGETYWPVYDAWKDLDSGLRGWTTEELMTTKANVPPHEWQALYLQRPTAEEGNILKRKWWRGWKEPKPPSCEYVLMSLDTAFSEKETADFSAVTTWGVFRREDDKFPHMILLGAQRGRWEYPELRRKAFDLYNFHRPDAVLIEKKASGQSLLQDLRASGVPVMEWPPDGRRRDDKVARAYACTPIFNAGRVWAPLSKNWADDVMFECMPAGTEIITLDGLVDISKIQPGDLVLTHKGRFMPVISTMSRKANNLYRVSSKSLEDLVLTEDHPILTISPQKEKCWAKPTELVERHYAKTGRGLEASNKPHSRTVLPIPDCSNQATEIDLRNFIRLAKGKNHALLELDEIITTTHSKTQNLKWRQELDYDFGWLLGLYLAEGSNNRRAVTWSLGAHETELIERCTKIARRFGARVSLHPTDGNAINILISLAFISDFWKEFGHLAHNKKLPSWVWDTPEEFRRGLIDGWVDGDGHVQDGKIAVSTVSKSLVWYMRLLLLSLGQTAVIQKLRRKGLHKICGRVVNCRDAYSLSWRWGGNAVSGILDKDLCSYHVKSIEPLNDSKEVFNLEVLEDNSYTTTGGVVHNCSSFPSSQHDDYVDTVTQAVLWIKEGGWVIHPDDEWQYSEEYDRINRRKRRYY